MRHLNAIEALAPPHIARLPPFEAAAAMTITLADIREWERLGGVCPSCKHHGFVNTRRIRHRYSGRNLLELQRYLHCTQCDNQHGNLFVVSRIPRD